MSFPTFDLGQRIRVLKDNGRRGLVGLEGSVEQVAVTGLVVKLDADPGNRHRLNMIGGFELPVVPVLRFFLTHEVESL